ncbi:mutS protein homolog 4 [Calliopsis andreniformis]|uniref:mutS protein homolog 4 n=1 Tax=Calliopsis andreniformis TaxID=337506 RepID=UPI003FCEAC30
MASVLEPPAWESRRQSLYFNISALNLSKKNSPLHGRPSGRGWFFLGCSPTSDNYPELDKFFSRKPRNHRVIQGSKKLLIFELLKEGGISKNFSSNSFHSAFIGRSLPFKMRLGEERIEFYQLAITTGRGEARTEVGMAALDIRCPHLILCQISDSQTYKSALNKLYLFDPIEVLMPDTMCEHNASRNVLYRSIMSKFVGLRVTPVSRIHFNDANGLERVKNLCLAEYSSVELFVKEKYYALAAAAALMKYVEYVQRILYIPRSMKIEFQGSPNATVIDLESARSLELVQSQCSQRNISLLSILDTCSTPMGRKLLRASILQPSCQEGAILERQSSVAELVSNPSLRAILQTIVRRLHGADRLVAMSTAPVLHENTVQCAEQNLNYILLLKNLLDAIPELKAALSTGESNILQRIREKLYDPRFSLMKERILETIHPDARSVTGYTSSNMQRCFAIKAGINDLLDIARQTYCELIDDMKSMVEHLAAKYKLTLSLGCNASLGYHIQAVFPRNWNADNFEPPSEFIEVRKYKRVLTMTTNRLAALSQQCKIASEELHLMSNVLLCDLLQNLREYIICFFQLSADVAELDLIISLGRISSLQTYVRPTFGQKLDLLESRHPILETCGFDSPVPNDVHASVPWNFHVITGPNMSGKSTYLKQIVLLHIMAQIGCFVPAKKATFRITDHIFCKIAVRDDIECNASTFTLEMKEAQHILQSVTPTSLIVLDELCKGTSVEEGSSIAWAICERLLNTTAFGFIATHFVFLTKLADVYCNVTNHFFETINARGEETENCQITYTHKLKRGVAPTDDYGIVLAEFSGLPKSVTEKARQFASERLVLDRVTSKSSALESKCYSIVVRMYELLETNRFDRKRMASLLERIAKLQIQEGNEDDTEMRNDKEESTVEEENEIRDVNNSICKTVTSPGSLATTISSLESIVPHDSNFQRTLTASLTNNSSLSNIKISGEVPQTRTSTMLFGNDFNLNSTLEHRASSRHSPNLFDSFSFCSTTTKNRLNELEKHLSGLSNLNPGSAKESCDNNLLPISGSLRGQPVTSPSFSHELASTQISVATNQIGTLYEYCFSEDDFEPLDMSNASIFTNDSSFGNNLLVNILFHGIHQSFCNIILYNVCYRLAEYVILEYEQRQIRLLPLRPQSRVKSVQARFKYHKLLFLVNAASKSKKCIEMIVQILGTKQCLVTITKLVASTASIYNSLYAYSKKKKENNRKRKQIACTKKERNTDFRGELTSIILFLSSFLLRLFRWQSVTLCLEKKKTPSNNLFPFQVTSGGKCAEERLLVPDTTTQDSLRSGKVTQSLRCSPAGSDYCSTAPC